MKIQASSFCLTFFFFQLLNPNQDETQSTTSTVKTMLATQIKAACNDKKDDESVALSLGLTLVSDLPERKDFVVSPELIEFLKQERYKDCSLIGLVAASPFLDSDTKSSMLKVCHKLKISSTEKDRVLESDFFLKRHPKIFTFLLCLKRRGEELTPVPKEILSVLFAYFEPSENS